MKWPILNASNSTESYEPRNTLESLALFESEGEWKTIDQFWRGRSPSCPGEQVFWLKSAIYNQGLKPKLLRVVASFDTEGLDKTGFARLALLRAFTARRMRRYRESDEQIRLAVSVLDPKRQADKILLDEAKFQDGMNRMENDECFQALVVFSELRKSAKSTFRKGMAALNECCLLWDQGIYQKIRELIKLVPIEFQFRVSISLWLAEGRFRRVDQALDGLLNLGSEDHQNFLELPESERENVFLHLTNYLLLKEDTSRLVALKKIFSSDFKSSPVLGKIFFKKKSRSFSALDDSDYIVLSFLHSKKRGMKNYRRFVEDHLIKQELFCPLIPRASDIESQSSPYANLWWRYLSITNTEPSLSIEVKARGIVVLKCSNKSIRLDLSRNPISLKLLRAMKGGVGSAFDRPKLHESLTNCRYKPDLHDDRLHKALSRLSKRIEGLVGETPWVQPGNRTTVLRCKISCNSLQELI
jgi:hypothetical protein